MSVKSTMVGEGGKMDVADVVCCGLVDRRNDVCTLGQCSEGSIAACIAKVNVVCCRAQNCYWYDCVVRVCNTADCKFEVLLVLGVVQGLPLMQCDSCALERTSAARNVIANLSRLHGIASSGEILHYARWQQWDICGCSYCLSETHSTTI